MSRKKKYDEEDEKLAITTRIFRKRQRRTTNHMWEYNKINGNIRVIEGTMVPNSSLLQIISRSKEMNKRTSAPLLHCGNSSSEDDELKKYTEYKEISFRELTLDELKYRMRLTKWTPPVKKVKPRSAYEAMIESIKESSRQLRLNTPQQTPKFQSLSSISTGNYQLEEKSTVASLEQIMESNLEIDVDEEVPIVKPEEVNVDVADTIDDGKDKPIQTKPKVEKKKFKPKPKRRSILKRYRETVPVPGELPIKADGTLPLRSEQDFSPAQVISYLCEKRIRSTI